MIFTARLKVAFASNELTDILLDGSDLYSSDDGLMSKERWQILNMSQSNEQREIKGAR